MTRAKTKVGESLEYIRGDGERRRWIGPPGSTIKDDRRTLRAAISTGVIHTGEGRVDMRGARVIRVTRYRLAPLIELPAWERNDEGTYYVAGGEADDAHDRAVIEVDGKEAEDCAYEASVYDAAGRLADEDNMVFESSSIENVKRWVEERLRLQGYKIAKAKKGKGS